MSYNYAERFERQIENKYKHGLTSADMAANKKYKFIDAQTIKIPTIALSGYKDHKRNGDVNKGTITNDWTPYKLTHDRDIEFYVDEMDVDETNQVLSAGNITSAFMEDQAIPETDAYRYSKLYADAKTHGAKIDNTVLTVNNILEVFDKAMEYMDEAGVPSEGRKMKVTPAVYRMIKNAEKIQRTLEVTGSTDINRNVRSLDEASIQKVPSDRFKTVYDFAEGFKPGSSAKQMHMMIYHTSAIIAPIKVQDVYLWPKGSTPRAAFGWLYQNRSFQDLFLIKQKKEGLYIVSEAE